jgi:hypothetical protein
VVATDVKGLVSVAEQVDEEAQRQTPFLDGPARVFEDSLELADLVHDAPVLRIGGREPGIVSGLLERDVHVMPSGRSLDPA